MDEREDEAAGYNLAPLLQELRDDNRRVREQAFERLWQIDPDTILDELQEAYRIALQSSSAIWTRRRVLLTGGFGVAGYLLYRAFTSCATNEFGPGMGALFFGILCTIGAGIVFLTVRPSKASNDNQRSLVSLLCNSRDGRTARSLCDSLRSRLMKSNSRSSRLLRKHVLQALARQLPLVKGTIDDELSQAQLATLRLELRDLATGMATFDDPAGLSAAILHCIRVLGDVDSILCVERLAETYLRAKPWEQAAEERKLCLETLYKLRDEARAEKSLLRSSHNPAAVEELLRQAEEPKHDGDELLRAGGEEDAQTGRQGDGANVNGGR